MNLLVIVASWLTTTPPATLCAYCTGVGFKSVFLVTNYAMIFSGPLKLAFGSDDMLTAPTGLEFLMPKVSEFVAEGCSSD